jgi:hypothetical protein
VHKLHENVVPFYLNMYRCRYLNGILEPTPVHQCHYCIYLYSNNLRIRSDYTKFGKFIADCLTKRDIQYKLHSYTLIIVEDCNKPNSRASQTAVGRALSVLQTQVTSEHSLPLSQSKELKHLGCNYFLLKYDPNPVI